MMSLGGIGSLRGFDDKEFWGNRLMMFNADYLFNGDLLQKIPLSEVPYFGAFWSNLSLGVFVDTGLAWLTDSDDNLFADWTSEMDNFKTDFGISFLFFEGILRLDIAKRTDRSNDDFRITLRAVYLNYFLEILKN
jgi:hypothetical protein